MTITTDKLPKEFFIEKIQEIVNKNHNASEKKKLIIKQKHVQCACPYCGDSDKILSKKRGYLWLNTLMFVCFNCETKKSFTKMCEDFNENIEIEDRIKIYNQVDNGSFSNKDYKLSSLDKLLNTKDWINFMNNKKDSWLTNISPIVSGSHVHQYLTLNRNIYNFRGLHQGVYRKFKDGKCVFNTNVLINMNVSGEKLLGIQLRNLEKDKEKRFFKIIDFEELYNSMNSNKLDEIESIPYNKLSHFYNILNINFEDKVTIFEGYLDSLFYPNSIGMVGLSGDDDLINFLTDADEGLKLQFFFDNDKAGNKKASKWLSKGYPVFLWEKLFEDILKKHTNRYSIETKLKTIKDLNDLVLFFRSDKVYDELKLDNYFSKDEFDKIYLDKSGDFKFKIF